MNFRHFKYFIAVAEEANISRAANRLNISQPPLTRQIKQLEDDLGVSLFNRTPKGMELTQAGQFFLEEVKNIQALTDLAVERTQKASIGQLGRLDVAIFGSGILDTIPKILLRFKEKYPEVNVTLHQLNKTEQILALRQRRITVGFNRLLAPLSDISSVVVCREKLLLAVNDHHELSKHEILELSDVKECSFILFPKEGRPNFMDEVYKLCNESGFTPIIAQEVGDAVVGVALAASGFGICLVPESLTSIAIPNVKYIPLKNIPDNRTIDLSCIYLTEDNSSILKEFLNIISEFKRENNISDT